MNNTRTIRVTGKGQIKIKPDLTKIIVTLEGENKDYGELLRRSAEDTDHLKNIFSDFGFQRSDLKTLSFHVDTKYENYREKGAYKRRFIGYKFCHTLKVEFESDNDRLGKILYALANCSLEPEFKIGYTVRDKEAAKNELLGKAVKDAKEKASILAQAAEVTLKDIQSIDYSWGEMELEVYPINRAVPAAAGFACGASLEESYELDIEPDDMDVSDTVTVIWEIA